LPFKINPKSPLLIGRPIFLLIVLVLFYGRIIFIVIMIFMKYKKSIMFLQLFAFACLSLYGQRSDSYVLREKSADSLAAAGNHKEAAEILVSIIDDHNKQLRTDERMRLEYKTG